MPDSLIEHCQQTQAMRDGIEALSERCQAMVRMLFFETPPAPTRTWRRRSASPPARSASCA